MRNHNAPLTHDQILQVAPAVFGTDVHNSRSPRYQHIPTIEVVKALDDYGYGVSRAQQINSRGGDSSSHYARHLLTFRPKLGFSDNRVGDTVPEVVLINSHNGTCSYRLFAGMFRFVCANGLIVGDTFDGLTIQHRGDIIGEVMKGSRKVWDTIPTWYDKAMTTYLSPKEIGNFTEKAMTVRYGEDKPFNPNLLNHVRRDEDQGNSVWHVFNRIQENLMQGGIDGITATGRRSVSRPIARVTKDVVFNRKLWDVATEILEAA